MRHSDGQSSAQPLQSRSFKKSATFRALRNPPILPGVLNTMGLHPLIARFVPKGLCRFCEGLKYPHVFIFLLPTFIIGVALNNYIPHSNEVLTVLGVTMFIASKARWD